MLIFGGIWQLDASCCLHVYFQKIPLEIALNYMLEIIIGQGRKSSMSYRNSAK